MAEIVEYRVEKTLDELNLLVEFGIFTRDQAKDIITKRENFEYILRRRNKSKLDYLKYIRYEVNLLESIDKYRKTVIKDYHNHKKSNKLEEIESKIVFLQAKKLNDIVRSRSAHISYLFRKLTISFQFDKKLWLAYIDFGKSRHWNSRVSALYWRLLRVCNDDEEIWLAAAKYEIETNKAFDSARGLYIRALRHFPKSPKIWAEYFKMELKFMDVVDRRARILFKIASKPDGEDKASKEDIWADSEMKELELNDEDKEDVDSVKDDKPQVEPIDESDAIISGHLPKVIYNNADKILNNDFCSFVITILLNIMIQPLETTGLLSIKDFIYTDIRKKKNENDPRITDNLISNLDNLQGLKELASKLNIANHHKESSPTKRIKKANPSKLELLYECYESKGLDATRKLFNDLHKSVKNQTLSLYVGMIQVESWRLPKDKSTSQLNRIRELYDKALIKFGKVKPKLWYEYLQFENEHAKNLDDFEKINQLYLRAQATLEPSKVNRIIEKYTLIQNRATKGDVEYSDYSDLDD